MALLMPTPKIPRPEYDRATHGFCTRCRNVKPRDAFPKNRGRRDGLHAWCRTCNNAAAYAWENDPANYRRRRDGQAHNSRRYHAAKRGRDVQQGPIRAIHLLPRALREMAYER